MTKQIYANMLTCSHRTYGTQIQVNLKVSLHTGELTKWWQWWFTLGDTAITNLYTYLSFNPFLSTFELQTWFFTLHSGSWTVNFSDGVVIHRVVSIKMDKWNLASKLCKIISPIVPIVSFNMTVLFPPVITCTHHPGCVRAVPLLCKVSGRSGTRGSAAEAAVWPHPVQCRHLDLHPSQGELLQVTQPKKKGLVSLHAVRYIRLMHNGSSQPQKVSVILCIIEPTVELKLLVLTHAYFFKGNVTCCQDCITLVCWWDWPWQQAFVQVLIKQKWWSTHTRYKFSHV